MSVVDAVIVAYVQYYIYTIFSQIGSRRVIQWAALIMVIQGVINKFGAIFIMIPDPVVGGLFCVMFGMITAFGERACTILAHIYPNFLNYL